MVPFWTSRYPFLDDVFSDRCVTVCMLQPLHPHLMHERSLTSASPLPSKRDTELDILRYTAAPCSVHTSAPPFLSTVAMHLRTVESCGVRLPQYK